MDIKQIIVLINNGEINSAVDILKLEMDKQEERKAIIAMLQFLETHGEAAMSILWFIESELHCGSDNLEKVKKSLKRQMN